MIAFRSQPGSTSNSWRRALPAKFYRPNSRWISQPSSPAAASGRAEVRVGAALPVVPLIAVGIGAEGGLTCEEACTRFENIPGGCEFGSGTGVTP